MQGLREGREEGGGDKERGTGRIEPSTVPAYSSRNIMFFTIVVL